MKIICLIKFVPDVSNFKYDYEKNVIVRENVKLILNPDDACALSCALKYKKLSPDTYVEVITLGPLSVKEHIKNLLRINVDKATIISDKNFIGSDTVVTSSILATYIDTLDFDLILSGTHTIDGDTSHVPSQIAEMLNLNQVSEITKVEEITSTFAKFQVDVDDKLIDFKINLPSVLSIKKSNIYTLPFVKYENLNLNVDDKINIITNEDLKLNPSVTGLIGSPTMVVKTQVKLLDKKETIFVKNDAEGIEVVYNFIKEKGFLKYE